MSATRSRCGETVSDEKAIVAVVVEPGDLALGGQLVGTRNPVAAFLSRYLSTEGRRVMHSSLRTVATHLSGMTVVDPFVFPWSRVRYEQAAMLRAKLAQKSHATGNRHLTALRGVIEECARLKLMSREDADEIIRVKALKLDRKDVGRALTIEDVIALYAACSTSPAGRRDAAVVALAASGGLRRSEVCGLNLEHWDAATGGVKVHGKGDEWRSVYLSTNGKAAVESWLLLRGTAPGPLVLAVNQAGKFDSTKRLTDDGVYALLAELGERAKVANFRPHDLRRTFITHLLSENVDALTVSKLAGHKSVQTTMGYDKRGEPVKQEAVSRLKY